MDHSNITFGILAGVIAISLVGYLNIDLLTTEYFVDTSNEQIINRVSVSMEDLSFSQIAEFSEFAIVGEVKKITPVLKVDKEIRKEKLRNTNPSLVILDTEVHSDIKIKVEEVLFGDYNKNMITVRVHGGETEELKTIYDQSPTFTEGERILVFIGHSTSEKIGKGIYTVKGWEQGTFRLDENNILNSIMGNSYEEELKNKVKKLK